MKPQLLEYTFSSDVMAFSTLRKGGCSEGAYASFNANAYCGDALSNVQLNRQSLCMKLGIQLSELIIPHQTHGTVVRPVDDAFFHLSEEEKQAYLEGVDALITNRKRCCVAVFTADCVPILMFDVQRRVVAAVHAGWRGTVKNIVGKTIVAMGHAYGTRPVDLRISIGPHIGFSAFEVGQEVYDAFSGAGFPMDRIADKRHERWHIDLSAANVFLMEQQGVPAGQVQDCKVCCHTEHERFFSARRLGVCSGRTLSGIFLQ